MQSPTFQEEIANSLSHGFGILFGIIAIPVLISVATLQADPSLIVGAAIFGFGFLMVYTSSTLYHSISRPRVKEILHKLDHISIFFLIAGSYTPFILKYMLSPRGITLLAIQWGLVLLGIVFKLFFTGKFRYLSTLIYLGMGWMMVFVGKSFFAQMPPDVTWMLVIGGVSYTLGVIFFLWKKLPFHHAIWHIFVLGGSICHYVSILLAMG